MTPGSPAVTVTPPAARSAWHALCVAQGNTGRVARLPTDMGGAAVQYARRIPPEKRAASS